MIPLTNHDFQWGRSEVVIIYPVGQPEDSRGQVFAEALGKFTHATPKA